MVIEKNRSWGMVIDTDKCNGCSGCVTACQVENNIPLNDQNKFERGRVMSWIRIERYWEGEFPDEGQIYSRFMSTLWKCSM